jgi:dephospho-CoA kinase
MKLKDIFITKDQDQRLYKVPCPVIGLTGGIATGKSSVSNKLTEVGLNVICADKLVKDVYKQDETIQFIKEKFPKAVEDSSINFKTLREVAFKVPENQKLLETFIYQKLPNAFNDAFSKLENKDVLVYDVPLLYEKKLNDLFDLTICIFTPKDEQIKRVMKRDSISKELAENIISKQLPIEDKKELSDFTIDNQGTLEHLELEVEALCAILFE